MLIDQTCYLLPDGTRVEAIEVMGTSKSSIYWLLYATDAGLDAAPLYIENWQQPSTFLRFVPSENEMVLIAVPCDLTFDDLRPVEPAAA